MKPIAPMIKIAIPVTFKVILNSAVDGFFVTVKTRTHWVKKDLIPIF